MNHNPVYIENKRLLNLDRRGSERCGSLQIKNERNRCGSSRFLYM